MSAPTTTSPTAVAILEAIGTSPDPLTQAELALKTGKAKPTVSAAVRALVEDGAIVIVRDSKPNRYTLAGLGDGVDQVPAAIEEDDTAGVSAATPAGTNSWDAARFDLTPAIAALTAGTDTDPAAYLVALGLPADMAQTMAAAAPTPAPACHCGDDATGHVHPARRASRATGGGKAGKLERARAAALAAIDAAGEAGVNVRALWTIMEEAGPIVWVGAYRLLNAMRRDGLVTVSDERKAEDRTARKAG